MTFLVQTVGDRGCACLISQCLRRISPHSQHTHPRAPTVPTGPRHFGTESKKPHFWRKRNCRGGFVRADCTVLRGGSIRERLRWLQPPASCRSPLFCSTTTAWPRNIRTG
eukprot:1247174-Rhodomonas_salina.1